MFGLSKKVITRKDMRTVKAGRSGFIKDLKANASADAHIGKKETKELWGQLRQDSMAGSARKGLTRKDLQKSIARILIKAQSGEGHINKREVKDIIKATGVSQKKVFNAAAEMRHEKSAEPRIGKMETQIPAGPNTYRENHEVGSIRGMNTPGRVVDFQQRNTVGPERTVAVLKKTPDFDAASAPKENAAPSGNKPLTINSYLAEMKAQQQHDNLRLENSTDSKALASEKYKQQLQAAGAGVVNNFGEMKLGCNKHANMESAKEMIARIQSGNPGSQKEDSGKMDKAA